MNNTKRIVVAGCRNYNNYSEAAEYIDFCIKNIKKEFTLVFLSGGCKGADLLGEIGWWESNPSRLTNSYFLPELVLSLAIRQYCCVLRLRRNKKFLIRQVKEFHSAEFFWKAKPEIFVRLSPYKNFRQARQ